jgi:hypothetical protein
MPQLLAEGWRWLRWTMVKPFTWVTHRIPWIYREFNPSFPSQGPRGPGSQGPCRPCRPCIVHRTDPGSRGSRFGELTRSSLNQRLRKDGKLQDLCTRILYCSTTRKTSIKHQRKSQDIYTTQISMQGSLGNLQDLCRSWPFKGGSQDLHTLNELTGSDVGTHKISAPGPLNS